MLEVHPPHERIHGFRDFLLHLLTITIGLLIALGLEGLVELRQHNHLRAEADEKIKRELTDNRKEVASARGAISKEREDLTSFLKYLQARSANEPYEIHAVNLNFVTAGLKNASWSTASATGALSLMEYEHVQKYADAYQIQSLVQSLQAETVATYLDLQAYLIYDFDPLKFPVADAQAAKAEVRLALAHLNAIDQVATQLDSAYEQALER